MRYTKDSFTIHTHNTRTHTRNTHSRTHTHSLTHTYTDTEHSYIPINYNPDTILTFVGRLVLAFLRYGYVLGDKVDEAVVEVLMKRTKCWERGNVGGEMGREAVSVAIGEKKKKRGGGGE
jgi:hypothetical protein